MNAALNFLTTLNVRTITFSDCDVVRSFTGYEDLTNPQITTMADPTSRHIIADYDPSDKQLQQIFHDNPSCEVIIHPTGFMFR